MLYILYNIFLGAAAKRNKKNKKVEVKKYGIRWKTKIKIKSYVWLAKCERILFIFSTKKI